MTIMMQFSLPITTNATAEIAAAAAYPHVRLFTVGQYNLSHTAWPDLGAIEQPWAVASPATVAGANSTEGLSPMGSGFNFFSSVCWFYGKRIADGLGGKVPVGLVSSNYENTKIEWWADIDTFAECGLKDRQSFCFNTMISPYTVGPMELAGIAFYQVTAATPRTHSSRHVAADMLRSARCLGFLCRITMIVCRAKRIRSIMPMRSGLQVGRTLHTTACFRL